MEIETTKPFKQSAPTGLLIAFLAPIAQSADYRTVTFAELGDAAHEDVREIGRHHLYQALRRLQRDHGKVFISVRDIGIKLATDAEVSAVGPSALRHVHRAARKARQTIAHANINNLSNAQRLSHLAADALLGLQENATRGIVQKRLEATFEKTGPKNLEAEELLKLSGVKQIL